MSTDNNMCPISNTNKKINTYLLCRDHIFYRVEFFSESLDYVFGKFRRRTTPLRTRFSSFSRSFSRAPPALFAGSTHAELSQRDVLAAKELYAVLFIQDRMRTQTCVSVHSPHRGTFKIVHPVLFVLATVKRNAKMGWDRRGQYHPGPRPRTRTKLPSLVRILGHPSCSSSTPCPPHTV